MGVRLGLFNNSHNDIDRVNSDVKLFATKTIFYIEGYRQLLSARFSGGVRQFGKLFQRGHSL